MIRRLQTSFLFSDGLNTSGLLSVERSTNLARGSKNFIMTGDSKPNVVKRPLLLGGSGSRLMMPVGDTFAGLGSYGNSGVLGSVVRALAILFFGGSGALYYNGASLSENASSTLQLKVLSGGSWGATLQAGLTRPSAPVLAVRDSLGTGMSGKLKTGTYSAVIHKIRSTTRARSIKSLASQIIVVQEENGVGKSARITIPNEATNGVDAWGINVSPNKFGSTGPHFLYKEVLDTALTTIDGFARSYELEWTDGDLIGAPLAPSESFAPPPGIFVGAIGEALFVDGCYGDTTLGVSASAPGSTIAVSLLNRPEEFPGDWLLFPPEPPTALIRGGEGFYYRFGKNSMGVVSFVGGTPPLMFQLYWGNVGISYPHNACVAEGGRLYAKTGQRGLCRIGEGGNLDTEWANPILDEIASLNDADTVLGWDENSRNVCIFNNLTVYCFNSSLGSWGMQDLTGLVTGKVVSAVTDKGALKIACEDAATSSIKIYQFNAGTGTVILEQRSDWHFADNETEVIRAVDIKMRADTLNPVEFSVYANENDTTPILTRQLTPSKTGLVYLPAWKGSTKAIRSYCIHLKQTSNGGDCGFEKVDVLGYPRGFTR